MASSLYELLKKDVPWSWGRPEAEAFSVLKEKLTTAPVLCLYDNRLPLKLACDASSYGIGAVLSYVYPDKSERPIAFASESFSTSERNYSQLDKEGLSVIFGITKFHQYLFGQKFILSTDNKALRYILDKTAAMPALAASRLVRWQLKLAVYDFDVEFNPTKTHANADMLSRLPIQDVSANEPINAIFETHINCLPITLRQLQAAIKEDRVLNEVVKFLSTGKWPTAHDVNNELRPYYMKRSELSLHDNVIMWGLRCSPIRFISGFLVEMPSSYPGIRIYVYFCIVFCLRHTSHLFTHYGNNMVSIG